MASAIDPAQLQRYSLFGGILAGQMERIARRLVARSWSPGERLISEGDHGGEIILIVAGRVVVTKRCDQGEARTIAELGPGQAVGEMEIIDLQPRSSTVTALEPVSGLVLRRADLLAIQREDLPAFAVIVMNLARDLSRRLRAVNAELARRA